MNTNTNTNTDYGRIGSDDRPARREGRVARAIETQTSKLPSDVFLWGAGVAMLGSMAFQLLGPKPQRGIFRRNVEGRAPMASFIGQWVPTLLIFGLYNKIVKVAGSDKYSA